MKSALLRFLIPAALTFASGIALATGSISVGACNTSGVTLASGGGLSGSASCPITYTDGTNTATGTANVSLNGYSATFSGTLTGGFTFFASSGSGSGTEQGYLFTCSYSSSGGVGSASFSGSCSVNAGGVGGATSSSGAQQQAQATVVQQVNAISNVISARMLTPAGGPPSSKQASYQTGMAAGNISEKWNAWAALNQNSSSYSPADNSRKRATDVTNAVVGADLQLTPTMVLGLSTAFDRGTGSVGASTQGVSTSGYSISPYLGVQMGPNLALDFSLGLGKGKANQAGGTTADSTRQFYAANLGYVRWSGNLQFSGKVGYLGSTEKYGDISTNGTRNANTSSKSEIEQFNLAAEAGYWMGNGVMPYVGIAYTSDTRLKVAGSDPTWDKDSFTLKFGANFYSLSSKVTGGVAYTEEMGRRNARNSSLMGNINFRF